MDYWPDGAEGGVQTISAPLWNVGYVSDNEHMWHRISTIGGEGKQLKPGEISRETQLIANEKEYQRCLNKEHDLTIPEVATILNKDLK